LEGGEGGEAFHGAESRNASLDMSAEVAGYRFLVVEADLVAICAGPEGSSEDIAAAAGKRLPFYCVDTDIELPHYFRPIRICQGNAEGPT